MDYPYLPPLPGMEPTICWAGRCSLAIAMGTPSSGTVPAANRAIYMPFRVTVPIVAKLLWCFNGATAAGNVDVGIYDVAGTRLISAGATAQSGTNALQTFDITDTAFGPGLFYIAVGASDATSTLFRVQPGAPNMRALGCFQQASAIALPATATFATVATSFLPLAGLATRTFV